MEACAAPKLHQAVQPGSITLPFSFRLTVTDWFITVLHLPCFPNGSAVKNLSAVQETQVWSLGGKDPLEEGMATHSSILAWKNPMDRESEVAQWCLTLCDPMDCNLPGSSIHGIFQARIVEWIVISFSRGSSQARDRTQVSCIAGRLYHLSHQGIPWIEKLAKIHRVTKSWMWLSTHAAPLSPRAFVI